MNKDTEFVNLKVGTAATGVGIELFIPKEAFNDSNFETHKELLTYCAKLEVLCKGMRGK